jgi:hypothetical protein
MHPVGHKTEWQTGERIAHTPQCPDNQADFRVGKGEILLDQLLGDKRSVAVKHVEAIKQAEQRQYVGASRRRRARLRLVVHRRHAMPLRKRLLIELCTALTRGVKNALLLLLVAA